MVVVKAQPVDHLVHRLPCSRATFSDPHRLSVTALSQQLPLRLMELRMPCCFNSA
jgi:hypothetical protein